MRLRHSRAVSIIGALLALGLTVHAAEPLDATNENPDAVDAPPADAATRAEATTSEATELPKDAETMLADARKMQVRIAQIADGLSEALREARANKDVVREVCLDDKLNQADVAAETAQDRVASMVAATSAGDLATVQRDFVVISALDESAQELSANGARCLGEEQSQPLADGNPLEVTVDPLIPTQETTGGALELPPYVLPMTVMIQPQLATSRVM
jgi:hypothetical protein